MCPEMGRNVHKIEEYSFHLDQIEGLIDLGPLGRKAREQNVFLCFAWIA